VPPKIISPHSEDAYGAIATATAFAGAPASGVLVQNQAYFFPFTLERAAVAVKMCCLIGGTANGNIDVGLYDAEFNYLISSGATAQGSTSTLQEFDITDTTLPPGFYWMAVSLSSATGTVFRAVSTDESVFGHMAGLVQTSAHPLPTSTASPVKSTDATPAHSIVMGVSFDTLI
jgi:hypothetical protein